MIWAETIPCKWPPRHAAASAIAELSEGAEASLNAAESLSAASILGDVVDVDHRGGDVGVAHVGLDVREREHLDGQGAERVAQVVEAQVLEARPPRAPCRSAAAGPSPRDSRPSGAGKTRSSGAATRPAPATGSSSARATWSVIGTARTRPDFGASSWRSA